jgi:hypothetical protein
MTLQLRPTLATLAFGLTAVPGVASAQATAPSPAASAAARTASPDLRIVEDDHVRIEETRVRGQLQRIVVHTRLGGPRSYEIIVGPPGRDPSQERGAAGQRAWSVLSF